MDNKNQLERLVVSALDELISGSHAKAEMVEIAKHFVEGARVAKVLGEPRGLRWREGKRDWCDWSVFVWVPAWDAGHADGPSWPILISHQSGDGEGARLNVAALRGSTGDEIVSSVIVPVTEGPCRPEVAQFS